MSYTKVRGYKDKELLDKVKSLDSFKYLPKGYWILGVRSNEDTPNIFDDKVYIFKGDHYIDVMTATTNSGTYGLKNFLKWSSKGTAVVKADEWYYDVWTRGLHRGKVPALKQTGGFKIIRDNNNNDIAGDISSWSLEYGKGINFHPNTYDLNSLVKKWVIGKWSTGCIVINDILKYRTFLELTKPQDIFTFCLINEF